ncbi:hypothetical protein M378DRAFT_80013 [Amanita muscaria Koide BX008]|uniref:Methyltransferase domain-containing protein n=1 Tax=Amanita muscaria (strain Koide BX008) TaxID=946122 RepID=A0A0C2SJ74_AMAMK|nr:hypothetical protein M378DRAFT_80013 [Amanita muscaria Koide BX008]
MSNTHRRPSVPVANREDITPWEFQPTPPSHFTPASVRSRTSRPADIVEEVTPWELYPAPDTTESSSRKSKHLRAGRPLSPSGSTKALQGLDNISGRRKSTSSNKSSSSSRLRVEAALSTSSLSLHLPQPQQPRQAFSNQTPPVVSDSIFNDPFNYSSIFSASFVQPLPLSDPMPRFPLPSKFLSIKKTPSTSKLDHTRQNGGGDPKFSTADRKILQELQLTRTVREAQFARKGKGVTFGTNGALPGIKHHPYQRRQVPYPRNYEKEVLDLDVWETAFCHDLCGSVTWHVFKTPPTKVLDLGCGTGSWILNCAKVWKVRDMSGLDIVPLQPDLSLVGSPDLKARITWIHANLRLPFPDGEFDYVHVKRIALGVPEDKWDSLLEEITRVMKPGGAFELIEEDLFFPGKLFDSDNDSETEGDETRPGSHMPSFGEAEAQLGGLQTNHSRPESPVPMRETTIMETEMEGDEEVRDYEVVRLPPNSTPGRPPFYTKTSQDSGQHSYTRPSMAKRSTSTLSLLSTKNGTSPMKLSDLNGTHHIPMPQTIAEDPPLGPTPSGPPPSLLKTTPRTPDNPRDHWLLERIYSEMLSSRFINIHPLSLLTNSLSLYFRDLRTLPAIQFTFPPLPPRKFRVFGVSEERKKPEEKRKKKVEYQSSDGETCGYETETAERSKILSMQSLIQHESRYVSLDETQTSAFSPSARVEFPDLSKDMKMSAIKRGSRLPNAQLHLDLNTLNFHLALRTEEVMACSESMWEWVTDEKDKIALSSSGKNQPAKSRTSLSSNETGRSRDNFRDRIVDMTREDFDELLSNFKFDMQDKFSLGYAMTERFNWSISLCQSPPERATFDSACEKWKNWEKQERHAATTRSHRSSAYTRPRAISSSNISHMSSVSSTVTSAPQVVRAHSGQSGHSAYSTQSGQTLLSGHSTGSSTLVPPIAERWDQQSQYHSTRCADTNGGDYNHHGKNGRPRGCSCTTHVPPTTRMSRALKVFVGWKP